MGILQQVRTIKQKQIYHRVGIKKKLGEYTLTPTIMTTGKQLDLLGATTFRTLCELSEYMFNSFEGITIDLQFRKRLKDDLGLKEIKTLNRHLKKLQEEDFIASVDNKEGVYKINPVAIFKGSYNKDYKKAVESYYTDTWNGEYTFANNKRSSTLADLYDKYNTQN